MLTKKVQQNENIFPDTKMTFIPTEQNDGS